MASPRIPNLNYYTELDLATVWPSAHVRNVFSVLFESYQRLARRRAPRSAPYAGAEFGCLTTTFSKLCDVILGERLACRELSRAGSRAVRDVVANLQADYQDRFPQAIASVLGMILHCDPRRTEKPAPTNFRRPGFRYSTFPNSPGLSGLMADAVIAHLCTAPLPDSCSSMRAARSYVRRSINGTILDPSMEAGQLLLEVVESWCRRVLAKYGSDTPTGRRLIQAGWEHLCNSVLYGIDLNPLAPIAVRTAFELTGRARGLASTSLGNLATGDFLTTDIATKAGPVDVVLNNPPWGEHVSHEYRDFLKENFRSCHSHSDTYLAYVERAVNLLKRNGFLVLALPSAVLTTRKAAIPRAEICKSVALTEVIIMPGHVFSDAACRSAVLIGGRGSRYSRKLCTVIDFSINATDPQMLGRKPTQKQLRDSSKNGWLPYLDTSDILLKNVHSARLGDVAEVTSGHFLGPENVVVSKVKHSDAECEALFGTSLPFGYTPIIDPRSISQWQVSGVESHLASPLQPSRVPPLDVRPDRGRIVARSLIKPDGGLCASRIGFIALPRKGVISIEPTLIDLYLLLAILNSETIKRWVSSTSSYKTRSHLQKLAASELRTLPIPRRAVFEFPAPDTGRSQGRSIDRLCTRISALARQISIRRTASPQDSRQINGLVDQLYRTPL